VSVVVSNYNGFGLQLLESSLSSVLAINYPNLEVILVDNASVDGSVEMVRKAFGSYPNLRVIEHTRNVYSEGLNMGVDNANGKYVFLLNNDLEVDPRCVSSLVDVLENDTSICVAQPKLLSYRERDRIDGLGETMDVYGNPITIGSGEIDNGNHSEIKEILSAAGSATFVRKAVFKQVGKFDVEFHIGYEDMDFALRIWLRGYRVVLVPNAVAYHMRGATDWTSSLKLATRYHFTKNRFATLLKNYSLPMALKTIPIIFLFYAVASASEAVVKRDPRSAIKRYKAMMWTIIKMRLILERRLVVQRNIRLRSDDCFLKHMTKNTLSFTISSFRRQK
jgi:GT2 family glycosyltransferase